MRILFISVNKGEGLTPVFPLGLAYVAGNLPRSHQVRALDIFLVPYYRRVLRTVVSSFQPQLIGVHVRNLDAQDYYAPVSLLEDAAAVLKQCRQITRAPIVIGGPAVGIVPAEMLSYLGADGAVVGEGETVFRNIVVAVESNMPLASVQGVLTPDQVVAGATPTCVREDVNQVRHPDWQLFSLSQYLSRDAVASVQTKRGCPFHCIYCSTPQLEGRLTRVRDPESVVGELEALGRDFGVRSVYFVDNNFNYPLEHAAAVCEAIISGSMDLRWVCQLHPGYVTEELVYLLKRAGCTLALVGSETGSEHMLANLGRGYSPDAVARACRWLKAVGIDHWASLLIGGPGETPETVEESLLQMEALDPTSVHIKVGIRVYAHTPLRDIALREGVIDEGTNLLFPTFYLSPAVAPTIVNRIRRAVAAHPNWTCNAVPKRVP